MDKEKIIRFLKEKRVFIAAGLTFILIVAAFAYNYSVLLNDSYEKEEDAFNIELFLAEALNDTVSYYREHNPDLNSWWELVALYGAGADLTEESWDLSKWVDAPKVTPGMGATEYAGIIFSKMVLDEMDLLDNDADYPVKYLLDLQEEDGGFGGGINNTVWAVIALDSLSTNNFDSEMRQMALNYLAERQLEDGGFSYSGDLGDPDMTAMVLQALVTFMDLDGVEDIINDAVDFLKKSYEEKGYFASYGQGNVNSIAAVISGLTAAGEDVFTFGREVSGEDEQDDDNGEDDYGLVSELLEYRLPEGSFVFLKEQDTADPMATVQSLIALGDVYFGETVFNRLSESFSSNATIDFDTGEEDSVEEDDSDETEDETEGSEDEDGDEERKSANGSTANEDIEDNSEGRSDDSGDEAGERDDNRETPENSQPPADDNDDKVSDDKKDENLLRVTLKVVGTERVYYDGKVSFSENETKTPIDALKAAGLNYSTLYGGIYISEIMGEKEDLNSGAGWKFKVNGAEPSVAAGNYNIKNNDQIIWWFAHNPDSTGP